MVMENKFGPMVQSILETGNKTEHMAKASLFMLTETSMKDTGQMTKLTAKESTDM